MIKLVVDLLVGIAWPTAVVWVALIFKNEIRSVLRKISQIKYKNLEASFDEGLARAEAKAARLGANANANAMLENVELSSRLGQLRRIANFSPRAAILEAWVLIEEAAAKSGYVQGAAIVRVNPYLFFDHLIEQGKLPSESAVLLEELRRLRNQAAHLPDFTLSHDEADRYLELAVKVSGLILSVE